MKELEALEEANTRLAEEEQQHGGDDAEAHRGSEDDSKNEEAHDKEEAPDGDRTQAKEEAGAVDATIDKGLRRGFLNENDDDGDDDDKVKDSNDDNKESDSASKQLVLDAAKKQLETAGQNLAEQAQKAAAERDRLQKELTSAKAMYTHYLGLAQQQLQVGRVTSNSTLLHVPSLFLLFSSLKPPLPHTHRATFAHLTSLGPPCLPDTTLIVIRTLTQR